MNLRTSITAVPPLLDEITRDVSLTAAAAGLLTTLPPLCMAAGAPLAPVVARRLGHEAALALVALTMAAGMLVRLPGGAAPLFAGTVLAALGIAVGNVLVPAIIKRDFPDRVGLMTGLFTMALAASGSIVAASIVPLERALDTDWRVASAVWAVPALLVALAWLPLAAAGARAARRAVPPPRPSTTLLRNRLALQVTLFMGCQSMSYYSLLSWVPELLRDAGVERAAAGTLLSVMLVISIPPCLVVPVLAARRRDQRGALAATLAVLTVGLVGLLLARESAPLLWVSIIRMAQGALLGLQFLFFGLRSRDALGAGRLAAMAQTFGFAVASLGPVTFGTLHDVSGGWSAPLVFLLVVQVPMLLFGLGAARARFVDA